MICASSSKYNEIDTFIIEFNLENDKKQLLDRFEVNTN